MLSLLFIITNIIFCFFHPCLFPILPLSGALVTTAVDPSQVTITIPGTNITIPLSSLGMNPVTNNGNGQSTISFPSGNLTVPTSNPNCSQGTFSFPNGLSNQASSFSITGTSLNVSQSSSTASENGKKEQKNEQQKQMQISTMQGGSSIVFLCYFVYICTTKTIFFILIQPLLSLHLVYIDNTMVCIHTNRINTKGTLYIKHSVGPLIFSSLR